MKKINQEVRSLPTTNIGTPPNSYTKLKNGILLQQQYHKIKNEIVYQWRHHKVRILSGTLLVIAAAVLISTFRNMSKECVNGFYDDWGCKTCRDGKWDGNECLPNYDRYYNLIESCLKGNTFPGCSSGSYYRELSIECKENPTAALCDGNYNHEEWSEGVYSLVNMIKNSPH
jgi:hypothetical protein